MLALGMEWKLRVHQPYLPQASATLAGKEWTGSIQIILTLIVLYLITSILTELLSNAATIVIMAPISLEIASQLH